MDILGVGLKIARLVKERGWSQGEFARRTALSKLTCRFILEERQQALRNPTVQACAKALGLMVNDLYDRPLDELIVAARTGDETLARKYEAACQPELLAWMEDNKERAAKLAPEELDKLYSLQGVGGPLTRHGVEHFVAQIERQRVVKDRLDAILDTEYLEYVELMVNLLWEKIQPYAAKGQKPQGNGTGSTS